MGIILDIIIIAIVIISTIIGYKRGLINVIFNLCAFLVALIITVILYSPITNFVIENTEFDEKLESVIIENGVTSEDNSEEDGNVDKYITQTVTNTKNEIVESTSAILAQKIISIIVGLILFIIVRLLLIFAKVLFNGVAKLPIIKQLNEVGGLAYGIIMGIIIVYVILTILYFIVSVGNAEGIVDAIDTSNIAKILYNNNFILNIIF